MRVARSLSVRFFVKISSAVNLTSAVPVPFESLKLSAVSPFAMPAGIVPPAKATSFRATLAGAAVFVRATFCPAAVIR